MQLTSKDARTLKKVIELARDGLGELEQNAADGRANAQKEYDKALKVIGDAVELADWLIALKQRVVVHVGAGTVQAVYSTDKSIVVDVLEDELPEVRQELLKVQESASKGKIHLID